MKKCSKTFYSSGYYHFSMLSGKSKIYKHPKADTLYLTIPSKMAMDSKFPFRAGDDVFLELLSVDGEVKLLVRKNDE